MARKIILCALFLIVHVNCIQIFESGNATTLEPRSDETRDETSEIVIDQTTPLVTEEILNEIITENETSTITTTATNRIPPTLPNVKLDYSRAVSEKPMKTLKDFMSVKTLKDLM